VQSFYFRALFFGLKMGQTCDAATASFYFTGLQHHGNRLTQGQEARGVKRGASKGELEKGVCNIYIYITKKKKEKTEERGDCSRLVAE